MQLAQTKHTLIAYFIIAYAVSWTIEIPIVLARQGIIPVKIPMWIVILFHALFNWLSVSEAAGAFVAPIMTVPIILWTLFIPRKYDMENCAPVPKQIV